MRSPKRFALDVGWWLALKSETNDHKKNRVNCMSNEYGLLSAKYHLYGFLWEVWNYIYKTILE